MSLLEKIRNTFFKKPQESTSTGQILRTKELRSQASSDLARWSKNQSLKEDWNTRTAMLGDYVPMGASVLEFGAGSMFLKKYLDSSITYTPSDIVQRYPETIVFDLNNLSTALDLSSYDTVIMSGVLEYVYDINAVMEFLSPEIENICVSYCCSDIAKDNRLKNGWLSDYTEDALKAVFARYNYTIVKETIWRSQSLFYLQKKNT